MFIQNRPQLILFIFLISFLCANLSVIRLCNSSTFLQQNVTQFKSIKFTHKIYKIPLQITTVSILTIYTHHIDIDEQCVSSNINHFGTIRKVARVTVITHAHWCVSGCSWYQSYLMNYKSTDRSTLKHCFSLKCHAARSSICCIRLLDPHGISSIRNNIEQKLVKHLKCLDFNYEINGSCLKILNNLW